MTTVGAGIQALRILRNRSARAVSAAAHLSPSYVSKIESGECEPSLHAFAKIAVALNMTPQEVWVLVVLDTLVDDLAVEAAS